MRKAARRVAIELRILDAFRRLTERGMEPRSINLAPDDLEALVSTRPRLQEPYQVNGVPVRPSKRSNLWSKHGVGIAI